MQKPSRRSNRADRLVSLFECLESRLLLSDPGFATPLADRYWVPAAGAGGRTIGIDGADADGDGLTISAISDNPLLRVTVPSGNRYAKLHFVQPNGQGGQDVVGDILVQLFDDRSGNATARFVTLATDPQYGTGGNPYYNDVPVHRVIPGFVIQTGDAQFGNGTGGSPLGDFADVFDPDLGLAGPGVLAMANSGPNTNDSQFFITQAAAEWLTGRHEVFGQVISGMDVVNTIINLPRDSNDRPNNPPLLDYVEILADSPQDNTLTMVALPGLTGEAQVTIALNDGNGGVTQKVIAVRPKPVIAPPPEPEVTAGRSTAGTVGLGDDGTLPADLSATVDHAGATVQVDDATRSVTVTAPANYYGLLKVTLTGTVSGWEDPGLDGIWYIDVKRPTDMPLLDRIDAPNQSAAMASVQAGNYLYTVAGPISEQSSGGLRIYDISDRLNPAIVGSLDTADFARDIKLVGNVAYIADTFGGIVSVDVSDPANPRQLDVAALWAPQGATAVAISMVISGDIAWVAGYQGGAYAFDISNPADLRLLSNIKQFTQFGGFSIGSAVSVAVGGQYLYVSDSGQHVLVVDVSDLTDPQPITAIGHLVGVTWGIQVVGDRLYQANQNAMLVWNVANPSSAAKLGEIALPGSWNMNVQGNMAAVARTGGYSTVDVTNPSRPAETALFAVQDFDFNSMAYGGMPSVSNNLIALPLGTDGTMLIGQAVSVTDRSVTFRDSQGVLVTFKIAGGSALLTTTDNTSGDIQRIDIVGTGATTVAITTSGGPTRVGDIVVADGSLKSFAAATTTLRGDFTVDGSLGSLSAAGVSGGLIRIAGTDDSTVAGAQVTLSLGTVSDAGIETALPIKSLTVSNWTDTGAADRIVAPWIGAITSKGNMQADLALSGQGAGVYALAGAKITGNVSNASWQLGRAGGTIAIAGATSGWSLSGATVNSLSLGDMNNSTLAVGDVKKLSARRWTGGSITAGTVGTMSVTGATGVAGDLSGALIQANSIKGLSVAGNFLNSQLSLSQAVVPANLRLLAMGKLSVKKYMAGVVVESAGSLGAINAAVIRDSSILAGVKDGVTGLPTGRESFLDGLDTLLQTIAGVSAKGLIGESAFQNSFVAAWTINKTALLTIKTDNGGQRFGLAGHTIRPYLVPSTQSDFEVRIV